MKLLSTTLGAFVALMAMVTLAACTTTPQSKPQTTPQSASQENLHKDHHPGSPTSQGRGAMGDGIQMSTMDMKSMCDMYQKMMNGKTSAEQEAIMEEHMKMMPPEMTQKHMQMMQEQCK